MDMSIRVNRNMTDKELEEVMDEARKDYRFYVKIYRIVLNIYKPRNEKVKRMLMLMNRAEIRYKMAEALLENR